MKSKLLSTTIFCLSILVPSLVISAEKKEEQDHFFV